MYGKFIHHAFNFFSCGWEVDNDINFLEAEIDYKILTCDPSDDIIDIYSSLYAGVALRAIERERNLKDRIDIQKYPLFLEDDQNLFKAMKEFFEVFETLAYSLKQDDNLVAEHKVNGMNKSIFPEEIKKEPLTSNKRMIELSNQAKTATKTHINEKYVTCREFLEQSYGVGEGDYHESITLLFNAYVKPFRNTFASLNAGVMTLYEILHEDHVSTLDDLKLFVIFLEIYGTGRAVKPDGNYISLVKRRKNSIKKIDLVITELKDLYEGELLTSFKHKELAEKVRSLSWTIIDGFKKIKHYLEDMTGVGSAEVHRRGNPAINRVNNDSENEHNDQEKCLKYPLERELGYIMPVRCGHRGYPKEKDKEKKAFDIFLHKTGFTSRTRCEQEPEPESESDNNN